MTLSKTLIAIALLGSMGAISISAVDAQPSPVPTRSAMPVPMNAAAPMPMQGGMTPAQMRTHMRMAKSPGDRAMMNAMLQMHRSMMGAAMTGDPDRDFMTMMIPHHQSAIDMAKAEARYGKDPALRQMARNMIKAQKAEIKQMRAMLERNPRML